MRKFLLFFALLLFYATSALAATAGTVSYEFAIKSFVPGKAVNLWIPYPMSDDSQDITNVAVEGNYDQQAIYRAPDTGAVYLYASWAKPAAVPTMKFSFHVNSHFKKGQALKDRGGVVPAEIMKYLEATDFIPANNLEIAKIAQDATAGQSSILEKAKTVYDWTIANTFRDPDVKGCGTGQALNVLNKANGGGKCADISSVFVTVARAAGVPARDVFGLRSTGKSGEITGDFHCWAEFYLPGTGWVMVDPADVRKAMLLETLELGDKKTGEYSEFFWNGDNLFRIALNRAEHGVRFNPAQKAGPLEYFMYPYGEVDGQALDHLAPADFGYKVFFNKD